MELATDVDGLVLRTLEVVDLDRYATLVDRNHQHLTTYGDFQELVDATRQELAEELRNTQSGRFGIWRQGDLVGRVDLVTRDGTNASLGYWIDQGSVGAGIATAACRSLLEYGKTQLGVTDVWAGVTHGNERSLALLERLGFQAVGDMGTYTRFHRDLYRSELEQPEGSRGASLRPDFARLYGAKAMLPEGSTIPTGAYGPIPVINGNGWMFRGGRGGGELDDSITAVRMMYPSDVHPDGYLMYFAWADFESPERETSWARVYREDPLRFERAFVQRIEHELRDWPGVEHLSSVAINDFPDTSIEILLNLSELERTLVYVADLWKTVDWGSFDPEMLQIDPFVVEFSQTMEDDLERAGFSFMHGERVYPDAVDAPFHVSKVIKDPSA